MYYKGSLLLNTIRHIIADDEKWWKMLYNYSETFKKKIITSDTVIDYFNKASGIDLTLIFRQYLYTNQLPIFIYKVKGDYLFYSWDNVSKDFNMPIDIGFEDKKIRLNPTLKEQKIKLKKLNKKSFQIYDNQFFVKIQEGN
jgi:aminopeptidase N